MLFALFNDDAIREQAIVKIDAEAATSLEVTASFSVVQYQAHDLLVERGVHLIESILIGMRHSSKSKGLLRCLLEILACPTSTIALGSFIKGFRKQD